MVITSSCFVTSDCLLLVAIDVRLMSHLLMHDVQHANRIADLHNQLCFVSSMTLMTLNPEVA